MQLNAEQQQAVDHFTGPCIVTATPGSGKTMVLTSRVVSLIKDRKVDPGNILCLTFTNRAAKEMKERVAMLLGDEFANKVRICTFHGLCLAILRKFPEKANLQPNFTVYNEDDQEDLLFKIGRMHEYTDTKEVKGLARSINNIREEMKEFGDEFTIVEKEIIAEYLSDCDEFNGVDFSGLLYKTWQMLVKHDLVVDYLSKKFKFVSVDETQDTNAIQYDILKRIASHNNLFVVGDINQGVYGFRGSKPENINLLKKYATNVAEFVLPRNYRSTSHILHVAQSLIRHNSGAHNTTLISEKGEGIKPTLSVCDSPEDEAIRITNTIKSLKSKHKWSDFAVLYRTNFQSKVLEMALRSASIPYRLVGGFSFFDRAEIKAILAYLSFLSNPKDTLSFSKAIATPKRSVGPVAVGKLEKYCKDNGVSILDAIKDIDKVDKLGKETKANLLAFAEMIKNVSSSSNLGSLCSNAVHQSGLYEYFAKDDDDDSARRVDNINEFISGLADYEKQNPSATLDEYLCSIKVMRDRNQDDHDTDDAVTLMTMHTAKGLEFQVVFVIGVEHGVLPHWASINEGKIEEERRLLFVGASRAETRLFVSFAKTRRKFNKKTGHNDITPVQPSMFLHEMFGFDPEEDLKMMHTRSVCSC